LKKAKDEETLINYLSLNSLNPGKPANKENRISMEFFYDKTFKSNHDKQIPLEIFNSKIVNVLGKNIMSTLYEFYDEIFDALMDDLLEQEV
jgi:hypothetical protein